MPVKVAYFLRTAELDDIERAALATGSKVRRGQGCALRVSAAPAVHRGLLVRARPLCGAKAVPVQHKARREYESRVTALSQ
ncbi:hypothetical protein [Kitasatospora sp. NPDC059327]|uniref:hypothetical protein n=1 Tax=Kitasatospora sp. NPDC059327 TaxID=3346803 RepID=UPI00367DB9B9